MSISVVANKDILKERTLPIVAAAKTLTVKDNDSYSAAANLLTRIKTARREVSNVFDGIVQKARAAWQEACDQRSKFDVPLNEAETHLKKQMSQFKTEQDRIRREEALKLEQIARRQEEERRLAEAVALEAMGYQEEAEAVLDKPEPVAPIMLAPSVPKEEGISGREIWRFRITDANKIPLKYLTAGLVENLEKKKTDSRLTAIRKVVEALKDDHGIEGIEAYPEPIINARAAAEES